MSLPMTRFYVVLNGDLDSILIGPFSTKDAAIQKAVPIVQSVDTFSSVEDIEDGLRSNSRNDVSIGRLSPSNTVA